MTVFKSQDSYWHFARSVRTQRRYIHTKDARSFLRAVVGSAEKRLELAPAIGFLWRAQKGASTIKVPIPEADDYVEEAYPFEADRMKPRPGRAREGRVNPKGIPYLYLATNRDTAVAEVRPWKGSLVSVGQFRLTRDVRLVNTTNENERTWYLGKEPDAEKRAEAVWADINEAFGAPTSLTDDASEYVPTQILGELFRENGFDGVAYNSSYGPGHNIALFDLDLATQVNCLVVRVQDISFVIEDLPHSYKC
jgi:hypothetical protein